MVGIKKFFLNHVKEALLLGKHGRTYLFWFYYLSLLCHLSLFSPSPPNNKLKEPLGKPCLFKTSQQFKDQNQKPKLFPDLSTLYIRANFKGEASLL